MVLREREAVPAGARKSLADDIALVVDRHYLQIFPASRENFGQGAQIDEFARAVQPRRDLVAWSSVSADDLTAVVDVFRRATFAEARAKIGKLAIAV